MPLEERYVGPKQKAKDDKKEKVDKDKRDREEAAARRNAEERAARDQKANQLAQQQLETKRLKDEAITRIRADWNRQVNDVVAEVKALRALHPTRSGINAGSNAGLETTAGGTDNPVVLTLPANQYQIQKAEVLTTMHGFDSSDSGLFKFRRDGVLVHCK